MTIIVNNLSPNIPNVFLPFCNTYQQNSKRTFRYHNKFKSDLPTKTKAVLGASAGALAAVTVMSRMQRVKPWNIEYGLGELIGLAATAITGGVAAGSIGATKEDKKEKRNEGLFQLLNTALPAAIVTAGIKLVSGRNSKYNTAIIKCSITAVGLLLGMQLASNITNKVTDPHNKVTDRKLGLKDALANIDDALGVFAILKAKKADPNSVIENTTKKTSSWLKHIKIENILPVVAAWCGYRAGQTN